MWGWVVEKGWREKRREKRERWKREKREKKMRERLFLRKKSTWVFPLNFTCGERVLFFFFLFEM